MGETIYKHAGYRGVWVPYVGEAERHSAQIGYVETARGRDVDWWAVYTAGGHEVRLGRWSDAGLAEDAVRAVHEIRTSLGYAK